MKDKNEKREFICDICGKAVKGKRGLWGHMKIHKNEEKRHNEEKQGKQEFKGEENEETKQEQLEKENKTKKPNSIEKNLQKLINTIERRYQSKKDVKPAIEKQKPKLAISGPIPAPKKRSWLPAAVLGAVILGGFLIWKFYKNPHLFRNWRLFKNLRKPKPEPKPDDPSRALSYEEWRNL